MNKNIKLETTHILTDFALLSLRFTTGGLLILIWLPYSGVVAIFGLPSESREDAFRPLFFSLVGVVTQLSGKDLNREKKISSTMTKRYNRQKLFAPIS